MGSFFVNIQVIATVNKYEKIRREDMHLLNDLKPTQILLNKDF
jgi:hypothetical protein